LRNWLSADGVGVGDGIGDVDDAGDGNG